MPLDRVSTRRFVNFINIYPYGPIRMSPQVEGLVETSIILSIAKTSTDNCINFTSSIRSSLQSQIDMVYNTVESICDLTQTRITRKFAVYVLLLRPIP